MRATHPPDPLEPMIRIVAKMLVPLALGAGALGCNPLHTTVDVTGSLTYGACGEVLPWSPDFATWTDTGEADGMLRIQSKPGPASSADDSIVFIINDAQNLPNDIGTDIEVGDRRYAGARASGSMAFPVRCPQEKYFAPQLLGTLTFTTFARKSGKRMDGYFEGVVVNARTGEEIGTNVRIDFSFPRRFQTPWQTFPTDRPDEPPTSTP